LKAKIKKIPESLDEKAVFYKNAFVNPQKVFFKVYFLMDPLHLKYFCIIFAASNLSKIFRERIVSHKISKL